MIVSWISHDNRKMRRVKQARARRRGNELAIHRVSSQAVGEHIVALTAYLASPNKKHLDTLVAQEALRQHVVKYIGSQKHIDDVGDDDIEQAREGADGERVLQVLTRNLIAQDLPDIQFEMAAVAGLAPGGEDPIEHIVLSWPSEEKPRPEQVEEALDILLAVAGMARHQVYAVLHGDTDNIHLHVALNRIDPATGERRQIGVDLERSIETLHQAVAVIEHRQGWAPQMGSLYRADDQGCYDRATGVQVRDADLYPCASGADRKRIRALRAREKIERKITSAARNYERRTGLQSIQRRVIEAAPVFREAIEWDEVHRGLAAQGMRYRVLTSGAVIECGDRTIAASTAWGGASAAKMIERLGAFQPSPPDLEVLAFEERIIPSLFKTAEQRRVRERLRLDHAGLRASAEDALGMISQRYHDDVAADPRRAGEKLNEARRDASAALAPTKTALELLLNDERARLRRRRALAARGLIDELDDDEPKDDLEPRSRAMLIGVDGAAAPPEVAELDAQFEATRLTDRTEYRRDSALVFVEHNDRIDMMAVDDATIRAALRVAHRKWGKVAGVGDRRFLDRLARIAVEEGIELTNPQLQEQMARLRRNAELERQLDLAEKRETSKTVQSEGGPPIADAIPPILADYAPQFEQWLRLRADPCVPRAKVDATAAGMMFDPALKLQLAELESQQFAFAAELRRAGRRNLRAAQAVTEQFADDDQSWSGEDLFKPAPDQNQRLKQAIAQGMIVLAPSPLSPAASEAPHGGAALTEAPAQPPPHPGLLRFKDWADRRRQRHIIEVRAQMAAALRGRVGSEEDLPRHIARLLLREAARLGSAKPGDVHGSAGRRDADEIAALSRDPVFADMLARVRGGDTALIKRLQRADPGGDVLGRIPLVRGRLDFTHRSMAGADQGARPPREWVEHHLGALDFRGIRLSRTDGLIGVFDLDLLEAANYNYVGLLYPEVQARLEVEWRLQREHDHHLQMKIAGGSLLIEPRIDMEHAPRISLGLPRGASEDERIRLEAMANDDQAGVVCLEAARGMRIATPLTHPSVLVSAFLKARAEEADDLVLDLLIEPLRAQRTKIELSGLDRAQRKVIEVALAATNSVSSSTGQSPTRKRRRTWPPSRDVGRS